MHTVMNKIKSWKYLRIFYIFPALIFLVAIITNLKELHQMSSLGIEVKYVLIIPLVIFIYQSLRNSIVGWILVLLLYFIYLFLLIINLLNIEWEYSGVLGLYIFIILIYLVIGLLYFIIRPKEKII